MLHIYCSLSVTYAYNIRKKLVIRALVFLLSKSEDSRNLINTTNNSDGIVNIIDVIFKKEIRGIT